MKARIITYTIQKLSSSERSKISKAINGYLDKSNKSRYLYKRKGIIGAIPHIKIANKVYIIKENDYQLIKNSLKKLNINIKNWIVQIKKI